jgi:hypothetical protein
VLPLVVVFFIVFASSSVGTMLCGGGVVARLPAARSALVMGPSLAWAVVWQFCVVWPGL